MNTKEFVDRLKIDKGIGLLVEKDESEVGEYLIIKDHSKRRTGLKFVKLSNGWLYYNFTGDDKLSHETMDTLLEMGYELRYADDLHSYFHTEYGEVEKTGSKIEKVFESADSAEIRFILDKSQKDWKFFTISVGGVTPNESFLYPEDIKRLQKFLNDNLEKE